MRKLTEGTPNSTTGIAPAELTFGRQLRTRFDLLQPDLRTTQSFYQTGTNIFDTHTKDHNFSLGDYVYVCNFL